MLKFSQHNSIPDIPRHTDENSAPVKFLGMDAHKSEVKTITYSFNTDECFNHNLRTLSAQQLAAVLKQPEAAASFIPLAQKEQNIVKAFFKKIECFANIKFKAIESRTNDQYAVTHHLSICTVYDFDLPSIYQVAAFTVLDHAIDNLRYGALIMMSEDRFVTKGYSAKYKVNTILHELLHGLGLGHMHYESVKVQLKNRSILENEGPESPLSQKCTRELKNTSEKEMAKYSACLDLPVDLTCVDAKGLEKLWGPSQKYRSDFCQKELSRFQKHYSTCVIEAQEEVVSNDNELHLFEL